MNISIRIITLILLISSCSNQLKENQITNPIILKAKETSLYTDNVDWNKINRKFLDLTEDKTTAQELKPGLEYLLNSLGDKHGTFRSTRDYSIIAHYTGGEYSDNRDSEFLNSVINDISAKFSYQLLKNNVGYLKVVGIGPDLTIKEHADFIRSGIKDLANKGAEKWILDLRYNGGGNMNSMIAALAPFLGDSFIGGAVDVEGDLVQEYHIRNGQFYDTERLVCEMDNEPEILSNQKVAVLLSRYTVSSGELVAVAFKGRENTIFIGENTGGYTTGNGYDQINDELFMSISQSVFTDRNMKVYKENVEVDIPMEFVPTDDILSDYQVTKAKEWLNK